ncbi:fiber protein, partial [Porcine adenovirus 1]
MGPKKQKRELPEDFDPVYPYDAPQLQINPPFVSGDGFHQSVDGVLSLHIAPPL